MRDYIPIYCLGPNTANDSDSFFALMYKLPKYFYATLSLTGLNIDD